MVPFAAGSGAAAPLRQKLNRDSLWRYHGARCWKAKFRYGQCGMTWKRNLRGLVEPIIAGAVASRLDLLQPQLLQPGRRVLQRKDEDPGLLEWWQRQRLAAACNPPRAAAGGDRWAGDHAQRVLRSRCHAWRPP